MMIKLKRKKKKSQKSQQSQKNKKFQSLHLLCAKLIGALFKYENAQISKPILLGWHPLYFPAGALTFVYVHIEKLVMLE